MERFDTRPYFKPCICVRPEQLSGGEPDAHERTGYVRLHDGRWARKDCSECRGLGIVVRSRHDPDLRCVCVRQLVEIPADDRAAYVEAPDSGGWARMDCLCKGEGVDPRLFVAAELQRDATWLLEHYQRREAELERHILRLNARLAGDPEPPPAAKYVRDVDGP